MRANDPVLILADESTGEIDPTTGKEIVANQFELDEKLKVTIIVIGHGASAYSRVDRILFIKNGKTFLQKEAVLE